MDSWTLAPTSEAQEEEDDVDMMLFSGDPQDMDEYLEREGRGWKHTRFGGKGQDMNVDEINIDTIREKHFVMIRADVQQAESDPATFYLPGSDVPLWLGRVSREH